MPICAKCGKNAELELQQPSCKKCFCEIIEKRIRKELRDRLQKGQKVLFVDDIAFRVFEALKHVPVNAIIKPMSSFGADDFYSLLDGRAFQDFIGKEKIDVAVLPWTADFEAAGFLELFFSGKKFKNNPNLLKLFREITEQELEAYAEIRGFPYRKGKLPDAEGFISGIEKKYAGTKSSLVKSREAIERILKEK